jgi:NAD(P)-dependent dehydrogenase (short-subunit alcohol dehydrogenase family)
MADRLHRADASKAADVAAMVEACSSAYGRIDVLDNNVGIMENEWRTHRSRSQARMGLIRSPFEAKPAIR